MEGLRKRIANGADQLVEVGGEASGLIVLSVTGDLVCWTRYAGGVVTGGPKRRIKTIRAVMAWIEQAAKGAGCKQHRICGRDWSRLFPDYSPFEGFPNGMTKEL